MTSERAVLAAVLAELRLRQIDISSELGLLGDMELRAVMFDQKLPRYNLPNLQLSLLLGVVLTKPSKFCIKLVNLKHGPCNLCSKRLCDTNFISFGGALMNGI